MEILKQTFLVTIEIDPIQARPCNCKNKSNTFPDWIWKYQNREQKFINNIWDEFRSCFNYDGLSCSVWAIEKKQFSGIFNQNNDDRLDEAEGLIQEVHEDVYPSADGPPSVYERDCIKECDVTFARLNDTFATVRDYVHKIEYLRDGDDDLS